MLIVSCRTFSTLRHDWCAGSHTFSGVVLFPSFVNKYGFSVLLLDAPFHCIYISRGFIFASSSASRLGSMASSVPIKISFRQSILLLVFIHSFPLWVFSRISLQDTIFFSHSFNIFLHAFLQPKILSVYY